MTRLLQAVLNKMSSSDRYVQKGHFQLTTEHRRVICLARFVPHLPLAVVVKQMDFDAERKQEGILTEGESSVS